MRASDGGVEAGAGERPCFKGPAELTPPWMGICIVRWFEAELGVRRSKTRVYESELTQERTSGECGDQDAEYVQLCVGSVRRDCGRFGFQIFTVPSQLLEQNLSFATMFQSTANTSRPCSFQP